MGKIKATRIITPRIVQPGEGARPWLWLFLLLGLGVWSWQVYDFGQQRAGYDAGERDEVEDRLRQRVEELEAERDQLRASAARFERAGQIDRAAADGVQAEVKALQDERAELKREVAFLKTLVSGGGDSNLALDQQTLVGIGEDSYRFEVTLSKRTTDAGTVSGKVLLRVKGKEGDVLRTLDMETLTEGRRSQIGIRFKNFQKLKTDIKLPKGFQPAEILVSVQPDGKTFKSFEQTYDWNPSDA
jgi:hypothetical protein